MKVKGFCRKPRPENPLGNTEYSLKAYFYLLPAALILAVFVFFPIIMTLRMGFYESYVYLTDVGKGFGLASFRYVLKDPAFRSAVRNTLIITFIGVPITIILSLGSALFINSLGKGKGLFQTIYFLPYVTSTIAIGLVFRWLFHSDYGYINHVLSFFGLPPQKWLTDPNLTTISVTIFTIWNGMAFKIVLFLAGLQKIDPQYYQAARMDETPPSRVFFRITMPLLSSTFWMVTIVSVIHAFKTYNEVYSMFRRKRGRPRKQCHYHCLLYLRYVFQPFSGALRISRRYYLFHHYTGADCPAEMGIEKIRSLCIRKETPHDRKTEKSSRLDPFNSRSTGYDVSFYLDVSHLLKDASGSHCHSAYALSCKGCLCKLCGSFHHGAFWTVPF